MRKQPGAMQLFISMPLCHLTRPIRLTQKCSESLNLFLLFLPLPPSPLLLLLIISSSSFSSLTWLEQLEGKGREGRAWPGSAVERLFSMEDSVFLQEEVKDFVGILRPLTLVQSPHPGSSSRTSLSPVHSGHCWSSRAWYFSIRTGSVTVSMSAFLACHHCYCAGSSLARAWIFGL